MAIFLGPWAALGVVTAALAEDAPPSGAQAKRTPTGFDRSTAEARPAATYRVCDEIAGICVHGMTPGADYDAYLELGRDLRRGLRALSLPSPPSDVGRGGSDAFDVYLVDGAEDIALWADGDSPPFPHDRVTSYAVAPPVLPTGCHGASSFAQAVAKSALRGLDAGTSEGVLDIGTSYIASLLSPCAVRELQAVDDFQRHPERGLMKPRPGFHGGALFGQYLDDRWGVGGPAHLLTSLVAIAWQSTPAGAPTWHNEPDIVDALRVNARSRGQSFSDLVLDFAVHRAFVGTRADGQHLVGAERYGNFGRVRFDWVVDYDSLPRRVAPPLPIEALGMAYVWVQLDAAPSGAPITFVADWEEPTLFRWSLVRVDAEGVQLGRVDVVGEYGSTRAVKTIEDLGDAAGLLIVGLNIGDRSREEPFDPDDEEQEPKAYTVTLHQEI